MGSKVGRRDPEGGEGLAELGTGVVVRWGFRRKYMQDRLRFRVLFLICCAPI